MRSTMPMALLRLSIMSSTALCATACVRGGPILSGQLNCGALIPAEWRKPIPGAELPPLDADVGAIGKFADAQTGQLDKANDRDAAKDHIRDTCEAMQRAAIEKSRPRWWQFWR